MNFKGPLPWYHSIGELAILLTWIANLSLLNKWSNSKKKTLLLPKSCPQFVAPAWIFMARVEIDTNFHLKVPPQPNYSWGRSLNHCLCRFLRLRHRSCPRICLRLCIYLRFVNFHLKLLPEPLWKVSTGVEWIMTISITKMNIILDALQIHNYGSQGGNTQWRWMYIFQSTVHCEEIWAKDIKDQTIKKLKSTWLFLAFLNSWEILNDSF